MKLLIKENKILGIATDDYPGPMETIDAPEGFTQDEMSKYQVLNNELVEIVPPSITPRQFWAQLFIEKGLNEEQVKTTLQTQLTDTELTLTMIDLDKSSSFDRDNTRLSNLASIFGYDTPEKMDDFFRAAAQL